MKTAIYTKRRTPLILAALILIITAALVVIFLLFGKLGKLEAQFEAERIEMADTISALQTELDGFRKSETSYKTQLESLKNEMQALEWQYDEKYGEYRSFFETFILYSYGKTFVPRGMPEDAIKMLERYVEALSTNNKELYLTTMPSQILDPSLNDDEDEESARYHAEYMINHFDFEAEAFKNFDGEWEISAISGYGGYILIIVTNENYEHLTLSAGITQDYFTGEWVIYDFD